MMDKDKLLTIKEFSAAAGVSIQALYQAFNKQLKPYAEVVDGKKMLNIQALYDIYGIGDDKSVEQVSKGDIKGIQLEVNNDQKETEDVAQQIYKELQESYKNTIRILEEQLKQKDLQIVEKDIQLKELKKLLDQEQQLNLKAQNRLELLEQKSEDIEEDSDQEVPAEQNQNKSIWNILKSLFIMK